MFSFCRHIDIKVSPKSYNFCRKSCPSMVNGISIHRIYDLLAVLSKNISGILWSCLYQPFSHPLKSSVDLFNWSTFDFHRNSKKFLHRYTIVSLFGVGSEINRWFYFGISRLLITEVLPKGLRILYFSLFNKCNIFWYLKSNINICNIPKIDWKMNA